MYSEGERCARYALSCSMLSHITEISVKIDTLLKFAQYRIVNAILVIMYFRVYVGKFCLIGNCITAWSGERAALEHVKTYIIFFGPFSSSFPSFSIQNNIPLECI